LALSLDLSGADAKLERARLHLDALKQELPVELNKAKPYSFRATPVDSEGWALLIAESKPVLKKSFGAAVGDVFQNLRCALDYVVSELVIASGASISHKNGFPIYTDETAYLLEVGTISEACKKGPLRGVVHGLSDIRSFQPFHQTEAPEQNLLRLVQRFSNADKHRIISQSAALPTSVPGGANRTIQHDGRLIRAERIEPDPLHVDGSDYVLGRLLFARPFPTFVRYEPKLAVTIAFSTPPFGKDAKGIVIGLPHLAGCCTRVEQVVQRFKEL
jgi:hypothetical protein